MLSLKICYREVYVDTSRSTRVFIQVNLSSLGRPRITIATAFQGLPEVSTPPWIFSFLVHLILFSTVFSFTCYLSNYLNRNQKKHEYVF